MKMKRFVPFAFILLLTTCLTAHAQTTTNTAILQQASRLMAQKEHALYAQAVALARQKGWPLTIKGAKGRIGVLRGIDPKGYPVYITTCDNIISAATIRTNTIQPGGSANLNLSGSSSFLKGKLAEWDEGQPLHTHVELTGRIVQSDDDATAIDHSTHVAGTMMATGVNPLAKGMAFAAPNLLAFDYNNDNSEMMAAAPGLLLSNHSYGDIAGWYLDDNNNWEFWGNWGDTADYKFGYYSSDAQAYDSIAYNAPQYLICKAASNNRGETGPAVGQPYWRFNVKGVMVSDGNRPAGISSNDGFDCIPTSGCAKNVLTVGAVNPIPGGYTNVNDVVMSDFSSWGPSDDGRIKPDVVADGVNVLSCIATSNTAYDTYSGTSMATPAATGSQLLLQEYYYKTHNSTFMRSATLKGLVIHTADEAGAANGPDFIFGWGLIDIQKAASVITSDTSSVKDQLIYEGVLGNTATDSTYTLSVVASGKGPLIATICWTDPAGTPVTTNLLNNRTKMLVNDLDVRIRSGSSTWYPYVLDWTNPGKAATTGDDTLNNVEKIVVYDVVPGQTYTIKVTHKGTLARGTQAYSLLVSGIGGQVYCTSGSTIMTGTQIDSVEIGSIQNGGAGSSCVSYTNYTNLSTQLQPNQKVPIRILLGSCDATTNKRIVKVFIDYTSTGNFQQVAVSDTLNGGPGVIYTDTFRTPTVLSTGNYGIMRIVAMETKDTSAVLACGTYPTGETEDYTVQFAAPTNDVGITQIVNPAGTACAGDSQLVTILIKNFGSATQNNVPVTTVISTGGSTIATLTTTYPDSIPAYGSAEYTYQTGFNAVAGQTYTISSYTSLSTDQLPSDDTTTATLVINAAAAAPTGEAEFCGTDKVYLKASTAGTNDVAFWYDSAAAITPLASGSDTSTTTIPSNKTYYLGLNDAVTKVGPATKMAYTSGGYNAFSYNFVNITNDVPVTIQSARFYIGYPGQLTFVVADISNFDTASGSYNISVISSKTINAYATTPTPAAGEVDVNNAADTGAVFYLGLSIPTPGNHIIYIVSDGNATIFRNNGITSNPYPFTIPGVFSITSNSAVSTTQPTLYEQYYYFFYDMRVTTTDCPSVRVPVTAGAGTAPVIQLSSNVLSSTSAASYQWYLNDTLLSGATAQTDTAVLSGTYTVVATDTFGCSQTSNAIKYGSGRGGAISLVTHPNPVTPGQQLQVSFVTTTTDDVQIEMVNALGQAVYRQDFGSFSGIFNQSIDTENLSDGVYMLKVLVGKTPYVQKVMILR